MSLSSSLCLHCNGSDRQFTSLQRTTIPYYAKCTPSSRLECQGCPEVFLSGVIERWNFPATSRYSPDPPALVTALQCASWQHSNFLLRADHLQVIYTYATSVGRRSVPNNGMASRVAHRATPPKIAYAALSPSGSKVLKSRLPRPNPVNSVHTLSPMA